MATYTSTTNPFLKSTNSDNSSENCCKKFAPGMAKLQSSLNQSKCTQNSEVNLLLDSDAKTCEALAIEQNNKDSLSQLELNGSNNKDKEKSDVFNEIKSVKSITSCEQSSAIAELSAELVEAAVNFELETYKNVEEKTNSQKTLVDSSCSKEEVLNYDNRDDELDDDINEESIKEQSSRHHQHIELIKKLRLQLFDLEKYAYERGELDQVPLSVLADRQAVILDTLKERLSLKICSDELEKLEIDELKKQIDKEVHDLIDPLITKEHLLSQLKTQLTDLERYIAHLHIALGKVNGEKNCICPLHGSSFSSSIDEVSQSKSSSTTKYPNMIHNESLPRTSRLIRTLVTQLICSDLKVQESARKESDLEYHGKKHEQVDNKPRINKNEPAWSLQIDSVILATDSIVNLFTLEQENQKTIGRYPDEGLLESVVRRQLVPAIRDLLSYGLFDPNTLKRSNSYASMLFDPYYLLTSLTCFPIAQRGTQSPDRGSLENKIHIWNVIEDYYHSRSEPGFKTSSVKTLSQSFNLVPSVVGPIKITSKQALLIAIDDIIETMSKCKPNGPESHFRAFVYTALNRAKLTTWLRIIFKNKSVGRKYYHDFSPVHQPDKIDKFFATIEPLGKLEFKLRTDAESIEQFVSAF